jgi:hypothetical protein
VSRLTDECCCRQRLIQSRATSRSVGRGLIEVTEGVAVQQAEGLTGIDQVPGVQDAQRDSHLVQRGPSLSNELPSLLLRRKEMPLAPTLLVYALGNLDSPPVWAIWVRHQFIALH